MRVIEEVRMKEESGAVLVIVALMLVALFGMVALAVDIGGLAAKRRGLVNASDSGALAAAISFAKEEADCGTNESPSMAKADQLAHANVAVLTRLAGAAGWTTDCQARTVTVGYQAPQRFFFAQVLGLSSQADVRGTATAKWGPAGGATGVVPVVNYLGTFQGSCDVGENPPIGTECYMWWDNDLFDGSAFGFMNLDRWDVAADASCPNAGSSTRRDWIVNGYPGTLSLDYPQPTYVCRDSGLSRNNWERELEGQIGQIKYFPVNDPATMICKSGLTYRRCNPGEGPPDKYNIIGFTAFRIVDVLRPQEAGGQGWTRCSGSNNFTSRPSFDLDSLGCLAGRDPSKVQIRNLVITKGQGNDRTTYQENVNYRFDPSSHVVTWIAPPNVGQVDISFEWSEQGRCGVPPANNSSAECMVLRWEGYQIGGSNPGGGANLGLQAVQLIR